MKKPLLITLLSFLILTAFTEKSDRSDSEILNWAVLANVHWVWADNFYQANFNDEQKELDGQELVVEGFMFPLEYTRRHQNFLVSSSPMSQCFFCGPGEAESMVYVRTTEPVDYTFSRMKVRGTFKLISDASMGIIYELTDAQVVR